MGHAVREGWRPRVVLTALAVLGVLLGLLPWPAAAATNPVEVTLLAPSPGDVLSGRATIRVHLTVADQWPVGGLGVSVPGADQSLDVDPGTCVSSCDLSVQLDTLTAVADGPTTLTVSVSSPTRPGIVATFPVAVDNHRPTLSISTDTATGNTVQDTFGATLQPTARDGAHVRRLAWRNYQPAPGTLAPVDGVDGPWRLDLDTSGLREGTWSGYLVLEDTMGRSSLPVSVSFTVARTMNLTTAALPPVVADTDLLQVPIHFSYAKGLKDMAPRRLVIEVDGRELSREDHLYSRLEPAGGAIAGTFTASSDVRYPSGKHTVSFVVTDSRGLTNRVDLPLTITPTVDASWVTPPGPELVVAQQGRLSARVTTTASPVYDWNVSSVERSTGATMSFGGSETCYPDCPTSETANWAVEFSDPGTYDVTVTFSFGNNWSTRLTAPVHVVPAVSAKVDPSGPVVAGTPHRLTGTVVSGDTTSVPGVAADLQQRLPKTSAWTVVATSTADGSGRVSAQVNAPGTADYRWVTRTRPGSWAGATGPTRTVEASAAVRITKKPTTVKRKKKASVVATATPAEAGATFELQRLDSKRRWVRVTTRHADSAGTVTFSYRPKAKKTSLRVVRLASDLAASGVSAPWKLRVRH